MIESTKLIIWTVPFYLGLIFLEVTFGVLSNLKKYSLRESFSNIGCGVLQQIGDSLVNLLIMPLYLIVAKYKLFSFDQKWSASLLLLIFIYKDFIYYWVHRLSHSTNLFWAIHIVHHQPKNFNFTVGLRMPFFHHFLDTIFILLAALIGFPAEPFIVISVLFASVQIINHTDYFKSEVPVIGKLFVTPSFHQVHHAHNMIYRNKNYSAILNIWDKLFNTYQPQIPTEPIVYGVSEDFYSANPWHANTVYFRYIWKKIKDLSLKNKFLFLFQSPRKAEFPNFKKTAIELNKYELIFNTIFLTIVSILYILVAKKLDLYLSVSISIVLFYLYWRVGRYYEKSNQI